MNLKLIIGLGNPDKQYAATYHNIGLLFIDFLKANAHDVNLDLGAVDVLKSGVYMNESGVFVALALKKTKAKTEQLLIVHDDSDLEIGAYKFSFNRNAGGHHGVASVIKSLNSKLFWRLRIGIRPKNEKVRHKAEALVLKKIGAADQKILLQEFKIMTEKLNLKRNFDNKIN